jgi:protein gp37
MLREWVISVRRQCRQQNVPFFFKQWGGVRKSKNGKILDGRTYDEMPAAFGAHGSTRGQHAIAECQRLVAQG